MRHYGDSEGSYSETFGLTSIEHSVSNESNNENHTICEHHYYDDLQYIVVIYAGLPTAVLGLFSNILLVILFRGWNNCATTNLYFVLLAFLDISICALYILLFAVDVLAIYHEIYWLWYLWVRYVIPSLALSRIIQLTSTFIVVAATTERFFIVANYKMVSKMFYTPHQRVGNIFFIFLLASILRLPSFWDYKLIYQPVCQNVNNFSTIILDDNLISCKFYRSIYNFYIMNFVQLFIPVSCLVILNGIIIFRLKKQLRIAKTFVSLFPERVLMHGPIRPGVIRDKVRSAAFTLVAIVTSYLVCNSLNLFLSIMEHVAKHPYLEDENGLPTDLYSYLTNFVSFLFMFNSSIRLFIHLSSNESFRNQIYVLCFGHKQKSLNVEEKLAALTSNDSSHDNPLPVHSSDENEDIRTGTYKDTAL